MLTTSVLGIRESNNILAKYVESDVPFLIGRLSDIETKVALYTTLGKQIPDFQYKVLSNNAGIYANDREIINDYCVQYMKAVLKCTDLACFTSLYNMEQNIVLSLLKKQIGLHSRSLEPYYLIHSGLSDRPWTHSLIGKRVLIVHPFVETFKKQLTAGYSFFGDSTLSPIFIDGQIFTFYKAYNTQAGNNPHSSWKETFEIMCKDILKMKDQFDIALLGCGGYGMPLAGYIHGLGKSAIYIGGGLQLLFGVTGRRWDKHEIISKLVGMDGSTWVRPSGDEVIDGSNTIEGGCYW